MEAYYVVFDSYAVFYFGCMCGVYFGCWKKMYFDVHCVKHHVSYVRFIFGKVKDFWRLFFMCNF